MPFSCPYAETCRAEALRAFADAPDLAVRFEQRLHCAERDPVRAGRCALQIGLADVRLPTLGTYIQARRRAQQLPVAQLAEEAGIDVVTLRDLEANTLDPCRLSAQVLERLAATLRASRAYLAALARTPRSQAGANQAVLSVSAAEVARLRRENEQLRMERDILKKAIGIFSRMPQCAIAILRDL